jgi:hypothetical protein
VTTTTGSSWVPNGVHTSLASGRSGPTLTAKRRPVNSGLSLIANTDQRPLMSPPEAGAQVRTTVEGTVGALTRPVGVLSNRSMVGATGQKQRVGRGNRLTSPDGSGPLRTTTRTACADESGGRRDQSDRNPSARAEVRPLVVHTVGPSGGGLVVAGVERLILLVPDLDRWGFVLAAMASTDKPRSICRDPAPKTRGGSLAAGLGWPLRRSPARCGGYRPSTIRLSVRRGSRARHGRCRC